MKYLVYLVEEVRNEGHQFTLELHLHSDHIPYICVGNQTTRKLFTLSQCALCPHYLGHAVIFGQEMSRDIRAVKSHYAI